MNERQYFVYILMNEARTVLYIGMTNNLARRFEEHRVGLVDGFTKRYRCHHLVHFEVLGTAYDAITREKELKGWSRKKKLGLIQRENPSLRDVSSVLSM